jgi:protein SCO1/2
MYLRQSRLILISGLLLCTLGISLMWQGRSLRQQAMVAGDPASPPQVTVVDDARRLPSFVLQRAGGTLTDADLRGRWNLLLFGYLHCPQVCPTDMALLRDVTGALKRRGLAAPQVVFVSVDSRRDGLDVLAKYAASFDSEFVGASANDEALSGLMAHLGVFVQRNDRQDARNYTVDHTASIYLIDPENRLKAVFDPPQRTDEMTLNLVKLTAG